MGSITVFTPTYNRAYILGKCYESLKHQSCKDFEWLIIDDGSTDNTRELVQHWQQEETAFQIRYIYKENGGLHTGYNTAIANMDTELSVCIDSDDAMPVDAIEQILNIWKTVHDENIAGIVGLDFDQDGELIGKLLPERPSINAATLLCIPGIGDKKYVVRNDLLRKIAPMPVYPGEKNFNPHYFIIQLSQNYRFKPVNRCFCLVEYQADGMSANIWNQYHNSPNSFAEFRRAILEVPGITWLYRYKTAAHYVSSCILANRRHWLKKSPRKILIIAAYPLGVVLSRIIEYKVGRREK